MREVTRRVPEFAKAHDELANSMLAQNEPESAIAPLERVIALEPDNEFAKFKLSEIRKELGHAADDSNVALDETERALLDAAQFRAAGDFRAAEKCYQSVLARHPGSTRTYQQLGNLAVEQKQFADAAILFKRAVKLAPTNVSAWMDLGNALAERERDELSEILLRLLRSFLADPRPTRTEDQLRAFLYPWLVPMIQDRLAHRSSL